MERLRYGMVGGAVGAYIGDTHRYGAQMDHLAELAAGCFSRDYEKNLETARIWKLEDTSRIYRDYRETAEKEAAREDGIDFVSIVTPNVSHYEIAKCFLEQGIHVVCDKPVAMNVQKAQELKDLAEKQGPAFRRDLRLYGISGHPTGT